MCTVVCAQRTMNSSVQWKTQVFDPDDNVDMFVLHCVFLPRINRSLVEFTRAWNMHPVRTKKNWSPQQPVINSMIQEGDISENLGVPVDELGVDYEGPDPENCLELSKYLKLNVLWRNKTYNNFWMLLILNQYLMIWALSTMSFVSSSAVDVVTVTLN